MIEGILLAHPLSIPIREEGARTESKRRRVDWMGWRGWGVVGVGGNAAMRFGRNGAG